jgi:uncharacterized coiled-coil DUF342 family protein
MERTNENGTALARAIAKREDLKAALGRVVDEIEMAKSNRRKALERFAADESEANWALVEAVDGAGSKTRMRTQRRANAERRIHEITVEIERLEKAVT